MGDVGLVAEFPYDFSDIQVQQKVCIALFSA